MILAAKRKPAEKEIERKKELYGYKLDEDSEENKEEKDEEGKVEA